MVFVVNYSSGRLSELQIGGVAAGIHVGRPIPMGKNRFSIKAFSQVLKPTPKL
jgi:hypothetical protein